MSKSPWGIGAWAAEAEREEAEQREAESKAAADAAAAPAASFPSLKESVSTGKQKKKTKMTTLSLQQFNMTPAVPGRGLTPEEMFRLPTGPKERSPEEMQYGRLGGGFSNYGSRAGSGGPNTGRREYEGRRSYGFEDDGGRGPSQQSRVSEFDQPSRADEVDNWASMKKQTLPDYDSREARPAGKYSSLGGGAGVSRADEVDNWASTKKPISQPQPQARSSGFSSGFSRPDTDRWNRNESFGSGFSRPESDRWTRSEQNPPSLSLSAPKVEAAEAVKANKPNPFGAARPREEVLAEKGLDWKKLDLEVAEKKHSVSGGSRPTSSHSSRPETPQSSRSEAPPALAGTGEARQKPKVNPFGDAKPREVLLEEKGLDWKKIDLKLDRRVDRPETEEEKNLKEEIEQLKRELLQKSGEEKAGVQDLINKKEQDLELLVSQLDDKVHYSQRNFERQNPGASRGAGFNDRPPSRTGLYEDRRSGFHDRPPSAPGQYEDRPPSHPGAYEDSRAGFAERPPSRGYEDPQAGFHERPRSRAGAYEEIRSSYSQRSSFTDGAYQEPRSLDGNERPRSRGSVNSWNRPSDDRRYFQGSGGRGFSGSRDVDRSGSRW